MTKKSYIQFSVSLFIAIIAMCFCISFLSETEAVQRQQTKALQKPYDKLENVALSNIVVTETIGQHNVITAKLTGVTSSGQTITIPDITDYQDVRSVIKRETKNGRVDKLIVKKAPSVVGMTTLVFDEKDYHNKAQLLYQNIDSVSRIVKGLMAVIVMFELVVFAVILRHDPIRKQRVNSELHKVNNKSKQDLHQREVDFDTFTK